jgi:hypothetical protein
MASLRYFPPQSQSKYACKYAFFEEVGLAGATDDGEGSQYDENRSFGHKPLVFARCSGFNWGQAVLSDRKPLLLGRSRFSGGTSVMFAIPLALVYIVHKLEASRIGYLSSTEANAATVTQNNLRARQLL